MRTETIRRDDLEAVGRTERELSVAPRSTSWIRRLPWLDGTMLVVSSVLAEVGATRAGVPRTPLSVLVVFVLIVLAFFALRGLHRPRLNGAILDDLRAVAAMTALAAMIVLAGPSIAPGGYRTH